MIRINLHPSNKKKRARGSGGSSRGGGGGGGGGSIPKGLLVILLYLVGWVAVGALGIWYNGQLLAESEKNRADATAKQNEVKQLRDKIDEERLQALQDRVDQLRKAIDKVSALKRTPVFVMHEMANILTQGKLPTVDEEEQRRATALDPNAELNEMWDGTSVWLNSFVERGDVIEITGGARDASDLSEFVKRMRASVRFSDVSHPEYTVQTLGKKGPDDGLRYVSFKMTARVTYWD